MAEEIQYLIDQIQKEGVEKAELEAEKIINDAKSKAEKIINDAKSEAEKNKSEAIDEAKSLKNKSITAIEQAARDLLITLGQSCEKVVLSTLDVSIKKELKHEFLTILIKKIIENQNESLSVILNESDAKNLIGLVSDIAKENSNEIDLSVDSNILSGFKIQFKENQVFLDYTNESLTSSLSEFLRPELAKIVSEAIKKD
jgi:V/A-type H+-transporting ATPase subunit E